MEHTGHAVVMGYFYLFGNLSVLGMFCGIFRSNKRFFALFQYEFNFECNDLIRFIKILLSRRLFVPYVSYHNEYTKSYPVKGKCRLFRVMSPQARFLSSMTLHN